MKSFLDVMDLWDSPQVLADDLGAKVTRVQKWRVRRKIPPKAWPAVVAAAKRRGLPVDAEMLFSVAASRPSKARRESRIAI